MSAQDTIRQQVAPPAPERPHLQFVGRARLPSHSSGELVPTRSSRGVTLLARLESFHVVGRRETAGS